MKIQIDTNAKTIKIEGEPLLSELFDALDSLFPKQSWKEYKLETNTIITYWNEPYYIYPYRPYSYPWYADSPTIKHSDGIVNTGVYNVELTLK